ncbi:MAG: carboxypeptidase-like regulatory domain-containing protein [Gammaproteobacteria bacterium]
MIVGLGVAAACAATSGQVVDEKGAPVGGAFIVTTWRGTAPNPFSSSEDCYSVLVTRTAADGTFKVPSSSPDSGGLLLNRKSYSSVYVPGYRSESVQPQGGMTRLRRSDEATVKRVRKLLYKIHPTCVNPSRVRELAPIFKAMYEEALALKAASGMREDNSFYALKYQYEAASAGVWPPQPKLEYRMKPN